jgi:hypothetical protein
MSDIPRALGSQIKFPTIRLLWVTNMTLLAVAWVLSIHGYRRLPQEVSSWLGLWKSGQPLVERSIAYFIYPIAQVVFFAALLGLAKITLLRGPRHGREDQASNTEGARRRKALKKEVVYLALIFVNLIFVHFQTSLTLLSHQAGPGISWPYFSMLIIMIVFILGPYYRIRIKILLSQLDRISRKAQRDTGKD